MLQLTLIFIFCQTKQTSCLIGIYMSKDIDILYGLYSKLQKTTALKVLACQKQRPCTQCTEFGFRLYADFF